MFSAIGSLSWNVDTHNTSGTIRLGKTGPGCRVGWGGRATSVSF